jgi:hypothetical protein
MPTDLSEEHFAAIFRDVEYATQETSCACYLLHLGFLLDLFYYPEGGGDVFLGNFR